MTTIGIDWGGRRIGLAVSDSNILATPHSVISNEGDVVGRIATLGEQLGAETYVVGVAKRAASQAGERKFREFADLLRQKTCKEVVLWNEAYSTVEAGERLRESGRRGRDAKRDIDMHAAAVILQSFLDDAAGRPS